MNNLSLSSVSCHLFYVFMFCPKSITEASNLSLMPMLSLTLNNANKKKKKPRQEPYSVPD